MPADLSSRERLEAALDSIMARVRHDRHILAAVLCGGLSHDDVRGRSDRAVDHIIDQGPEGGRGGGQIIIAGTPEEVAACPESHTGRFLRQHL